MTMQPTRAQTSRLKDARIVIEDAIALMPVSDIPRIIAFALLKANDPEIVEAMANEIGRYAGHAARGDLADVLRRNGGL